MTYGKFAPFIHTDRTVSFMEASYLIALLPCVAYAVFMYGIRALVLILTSAFLTLFFSIFLARCNHKTKKISLNGVTSGVLFALMLPPDTSLVIVVAGSIFMSFASEMIFGGVAFMPVNNPAAARILVELMWPEHLRGFAETGGRWFSLKSLISFGRTSSSVGSQLEDYHIGELMTEGYPSYIGLCSVVIMVIGIIYLIHTRTIRLTAPLSYLISVIAIRISLHFRDGVKSNLSFVLVSGIIFVAFFLLTDRATIPQNRPGGIATGIICGILTAGAFELTDGILPLCVPVVSVGLISGLIEYLTSDASERHEIVKEEA